MFPDSIFPLQTPVTQKSRPSVFSSKSQKSINISSKSQKWISAVRLCDFTLCVLTPKPQKVTSPGPIPHSKIRPLISSFYDVLGSQIPAHGCFCLVKVPKDSKIRDWPSIFMNFGSSIRLVLLVLFLCMENASSEITQDRTHLILADFGFLMMLKIRFLRFPWLLGVGILMGQLWLLGLCFLFPIFHLLRGYELGKSLKYLVGLGF